MNIGAGLPDSIPGATGGQLLRWARRADAAGFDELILHPTVAHPEQADLPAQATG